MVMKNIQILSEVHKELKMFAAKHDMTIREIVEDAVSMYMTDKEKEENNPLFK